jgi:hypothetical protein
MSQLLTKMRICRRCCNGFFSFEDASKPTTLYGEPS